MTLRADLSHFLSDHTELGGPKQGKQLRAGGTFSFLNKHISQFIEESWAARVTSGNNSQDEILTCPALNTAGPFIQLYECQFIQHSAESLKLAAEEIGTHTHK